MDKATITCPKCSHLQEIEIPMDRCLASYKCNNCKEMISVPNGSKNCCVICEFSNKRCPVSKK